MEKQGKKNNLMHIICSKKQFILIMLQNPSKETETYKAAASSRISSRSYYSHVLVQQYSYIYVLPISFLFLVSFCFRTSSKYLFLNSLYAIFRLRFKILNMAAALIYRIIHLHHYSTKQSFTLITSTSSWSFLFNINIIFVCQIGIKS